LRPRKNPNGKPTGPYSLPCLAIYSGRQKKLPLDFGVYLKLEAMDFKAILFVD